MYMDTFHRRVLPPPGCHVISPSRCRDDERDRSIPNRVVEPIPGPSGVPEKPSNADVSDAVLRAFLGAIIELFLGVSGFNPDLPGAGLSAGARAGSISRASSRTSTAPSSLLNLLTISCSPYLSTKIARFGCTSQTLLRMRKRFSRTTARLCESRSMIRLKNAAFARPIVSGLETRQILRSGSSKFSNELALAETKHLSNASSDSDLTS